MLGAAVERKGLWERIVLCYSAMACTRWGAYEVCRQHAHWLHVHATPVASALAAVMIVVLLTVSRLPRCAGLLWQQMAAQLLFAAG